VAVQLGLGGGKQTELGGDLGGQILKGDSGVAGVQRQRGAGGAKPLVARAAPCWPWEALAMTWCRRARPAATSLWGSA
jgi:hypothetical protein